MYENEPPDFQLNVGQSLASLLCSQIERACRGALHQRMRNRQHPRKPTYGKISISTTMMRATCLKSAKSMTIHSLIIWCGCWYLAQDKLSPYQSYQITHPIAIPLWGRATSATPSAPCGSRIRIVCWSMICINRITCILGGNTRRTVAAPTSGPSRPDGYGVGTGSRGKSCPSGVSRINSRLPSPLFLTSVH